jgi:hypothetical protein
VPPTLVVAADGVKRAAYDESVIAPREDRFPFGPAIVFVGGLGLGAACITLMFLSMRSVMEIGGACADGGPYVSAQPCPDNVPGIMVGSIWGLVLACAVAGVAAVKMHRGYGAIVLLAWPALFLSLGWNFLEYGLDPPGQDGTEIGWLICAVVFFAMGGGPLLPVLWHPRRFWRLFWPSDDPYAEGRTLQRFGLPTRGLRVDPPVDARPFASRGAAPRRGPTPASASRNDDAPDAGDGDLVDRLERLDRLHREGALDDAEYDAAKRAVIDEAEQSA